MSPIQVKITVEYEDADGSGDECAGCGDRCWLTEVRCWMVIAGERASVACVLCQACGDAVRQGG